MEQNECTPPSRGRGRPVGNPELRTPAGYPTYASPDFSPEANNTNGIMLPETSMNSARDARYLPSPSVDSYGSPQAMNSSGAQASKLSPFAKEFVPRSFSIPQEVRPISFDMSPDMSVTSRVESYPVKELRSFLNEITMNPGKFEMKIHSLTNTLNTMVDDDDTMRAIVNIIFDESVRQPNLRYSGARLCKSLCNDLDASPDRLNFRSVLFTRCNQEFKRREHLAEAEDGGTYLRGFALFLAELFSQLEVQQQRVAVIGDNLPNLIKTLLQYSETDNLKCACQILKLVGAFLDDYERAKIVNNGVAVEMDSIMHTLKNLANSPDCARNIRDIINSVIKLRDSDWGRVTAQSDNSEYETSPPPVNVDEPVMYGPDGKPMSTEELMFLQSQYASSNMQPDMDDLDLYDDPVNDEFSDEIAEAYEEFIRQSQPNMRH